MFPKRLVIVAAFALLLAACGGGGNDTVATTTQATEVSDGAMTETTMAADDTMTDDTMTDDTMTDDTMTDDTMTDDTMTDDTMTDDTMTDSMSDHMDTAFTITITNNSGSSDVPTAISPGVFAVHTSMDTLFAAGAADRGEGLEALAEDGIPGPLLTALEGNDTVFHTHVFDTPDGASSAGVAAPGSSYRFSFHASPGDYLSFATMFVESNDWFFAPAPTGISLFDGNTPLQGDVSDQVLLWDAGTEVDEPLGSGPNQGSREPAPNTGDADNAPVTAVSGYAGTLTVTISVDG